MKGQAAELTLESALETLRQLMCALGPQRSFHGAMRDLLRTLAQRHAFLRPHLVIYDPEARILRLCLAESPAHATTVSYEPGVGISGQVFTLGRPVILERISDNSLFQNRFFSRTRTEMEELSFLCVPVFTRHGLPSEKDEVLGVLSADCPVAPRHILEQRCRFLESIAALVGHQVSYLQDKMCCRAWNAIQAAEALDITLPPQVVAVSRSMRQIMRQITQESSSRSTVLLQGEHSSGKCLLATMLHSLSPRCAGPFVRIDCDALPGSVEAQLFGIQNESVPGTPQVSRGLLESAANGTAYLNALEILPESAQQRLLQLIRDQELLRVGATRAVHADIRILCGTSAVSGTARLPLQPDLARQLAPFTLTIPPLRERQEDIPPLAEHFLLQAATEQRKDVRRISAPALDLLHHYGWPGNVGELRSCLTRAVRVCEEETLRAWHLPSVLQAGATPHEEAVGFSEAVQRFERELIINALRSAGGNMLEASRLLEASYRVINYKIKKYGLNPRAFMPAK